MLRAKFPNITKLVLPVLFLAIFLFGSLAQGAGPCGDPSLTVDPATGICTKGVSAGPGLLGSNSVADLIFKIINILLGLGGLIAVLYIVIGGYRYITSSGNEKAAETGKHTAVNALIGFVLIILAYIIVRILNTTILWG